MSGEFKVYLRVVDKGCDVFVSSDLHAKVLLLDHTELAVREDSVGEGGVDVALVLGHGPLQDLSLHLGNRPACLQRHAPDTVAHRNKTEKINDVLQMQESTCFGTLILSRLSLFVYWLSTFGLRRVDMFPLKVVHFQMCLREFCVVKQISVKCLGPQFAVKRSQV